MSSSDISNCKSKQLNNICSNIKLENVKSPFILKKILANLQRNQSLKIIKYNRKLQNKANISIKDYKEYPEIYSSIEIEIIPKKKIYSKFINIRNNEEKKYYHIYFDDNKEEIKRNYLTEKDKVERIKIILDYQIISFQELFNYCICIKSINFKKFHRTNINNMSCLFRGCTSLKELNLQNFNTNNVTDMSYMFYGCISLKVLNINKFITNNVADMSYMFCQCESLDKLNIDNFLTDNVTNMSYMFYYCSSLKELNLSDFNTYKVTKLSYMFHGCSDELKNKYEIKNPNICIFI